MEVITQTEKLPLASAITTEMRDTMVLSKKTILKLYEMVQNGAESINVEDIRSYIKGSDIKETRIIMADLNKEAE